MDSFLDSPALFDDLSRRKINDCGTVHQNHVGVSLDVQGRTR
jgi:hypothetical protein